MDQANPHSDRPSRRALLSAAGCGFGSLALAGLCAEQVRAEKTRANKTQAKNAQSGQRVKNPLAARTPHHTPKAKRAIFIFMQGGPSQVDTYDPKPRLIRDHGKKVEFYNARRLKRQMEPVMKSPWKFKRYGESGRWVSDLFPHMAQHVDDYCVIRSMHTEGVAHGPATLFLHTGATNLIRPSVGSWITYGLGTVNENLPGFVSISPPMTKGGPRNYGNAFLPTLFHGTRLGRVGEPVAKARLKHISNSRMTADDQRRQLSLLQSMNMAQLDANGGGDDLEAAISSFELAYRMQNHAPSAIDLSRESKATLDMYGIGERHTDAFGRQCLMARRLAEQDVRYIQINYADHGATPRWDQHSGIHKHETHAAATDKPVAGLLKDLRARGLLEDTLVWWGGEFGRTPFSQNKQGRDHNPTGFTVWLAGGGVKPGHVHGETDEFGHSAVVDKVHMHDLHATVLHQLGLDHERLTFRHAGRDFRLTDVHGEVVHSILA